MKCPICSKEISEQSKFCVSCGKKIPRCPSCGKVIRKKTRFCVYDGTEIPVEILAVFQEVKSEETVKANKEQENRKQEIQQQPKQQQKQIIEKPQKENTSKKSKKVWWILLLLLLVAVLGLGGFFAWKYFAKKDVRSDFANEMQKEYEELQQWGEVEPENQYADETAEECDESEDVVEPEETKLEERPKAVVHEYEVIPSDGSWEEAKRMCEQAGGYLATITSQEEYEKVSGLAEKSGLTYLWIGGYLSDAWDDWAECLWMTGEPWTFEKWYPGEPSMVDADGTKEAYLCLWNAKYEGESIGWTFNDQRNDIVEIFPSISGKLGYICEYEKEVIE